MLHNSFQPPWNANSAYHHHQPAFQQARWSFQQQQTWQRSQFMQGPTPPPAPDYEDDLLLELNRAMLFQGVDLVQPQMQSLAPEWRYHAPESQYTFPTRPVQAAPPYRPVKPLPTRVPRAPARPSATTPSIESDLEESPFPSFANLPPAPQPLLPLSPPASTRSLSPIAPTVNSLQVPSSPTPVTHAIDFNPGRGDINHPTGLEMREICRAARDDRGVATAFEACGGAFMLLNEIYPTGFAPALGTYHCPMANSGCGYAGSKDRDLVRRHLKDRHNAFTDWVCPICRTSMGAGASGQLSHEASHRADHEVALRYEESGKILPCPNAAEIRRLAMMDVSSEDEPALLFECGEAEHIMLALHPNPPVPHKNYPCPFRRCENRAPFERYSWRKDHFLAHQGEARRHRKKART